MREIVIAPTVHDPDSTKSMFLGVAVNSSSAPLSITEIRPIETSRPLTRLLRVNRNSARSDRKPADGGDQHRKHHRDRKRQMRDSVKCQVA